MTARALRRAITNVVDVVTEDGLYLRALRSADACTVIEVRQTATDELDFRITGSEPQGAVKLAEMMLATQVDLRRWYSYAKRFPWLAELSRTLRGMKPPRYPSLFEALCNGIVFQQLSIAAASTIMGRLVQRLSQPVYHRGIALYPFPEPDALINASAGTLHAIGLSHQKVNALRCAAAAVSSGDISSAQIERLPSADAARLLQDLTGIGPWSAANILLRGFRRLDVFPMGDSGALANIRLLSCDAHVDLAKVLTELGDMRGMLYFHLLLGRMLAPRNTS